MEIHKKKEGIKKMAKKCKEFKAEEIEKLEIKCKIFKICVVSSQSNKIEISWSDTTMRSLKIKQEGRKLAICDHAAIGIYGTLALINLKKDAQLLIKIPEQFSGKLILQNKNETIHLMDVSIRGDIGISSNAGEIILENVNANLMDIRGNHGKVECYAVDVSDVLDISSENGSIYCCINDMEENYMVHCDTQNHRCSCPKTGGDGPKKLRIVSKLGSISVEFQNGTLAEKTVSRYNRHGSFEDW